MPDIIIIDRLMLIIQIFQKRAEIPLAKLQIALLNLHLFRNYYTQENSVFMTFQDIINFDYINP